MKLLAPLFITASLSINAQAVTVFADLGGGVWTETQTLSQSVSSLSSSFIFDQFNPSLGVLTGCSITIEESTDSGSFKVTAITNLRVKSPTDAITLTDLQASGGGYTGSRTALLTNPGTATALGDAITAGSNKTYTLTNTGLIGPTPVTKDLSGFLATYTGPGTVSFGAQIAPQIQVTGGSGTQDLDLWTNTTRIALVYTYTAVPEPSSALLGGLGALALLRRRRA